MIKKGLSHVGTFFLFAVSLLPFWFLYLLADILFLLLYYVVKYRRKVVLENLRNSFPQKTVAEIKAIEKKYFRYLADLIIETVKVINIPGPELKRRMVVKNPEIIDNYYKQGRSVIAVGGHYCNWEMAGLGFCFYTSEKFVIVYKPLTNETFDSFFIRMRSRFGNVLIPMKQTLRKMIEFKKERTTIALLGDQTPVREDATYFTNFLNQQTAVFLGPEKLAKSMDTPVIFYAMKRVKRGFYEVTLINLFEHPKQTAPFEITNAHVAQLEICINQAPEYWLWSHRRWKFKPE